MLAVRTRNLNAIDGLRLATLRHVLAATTVPTLEGVVAVVKEIDHAAPDSDEILLLCRLSSETGGIAVVATDGLTKLLHDFGAVLGHAGMIGHILRNAFAVLDVLIRQVGHRHIGDGASEVECWQLTNDRHGFPSPSGNVTTLNKHRRNASGHRSIV